MTYSYPLAFIGEVPGAWAEPRWTSTEYAAAFQQAARLMNHLPTVARPIFQSAIRSARRKAGEIGRVSTSSDQRTDLELAAVEAFRDYCYVASSAQNASLASFKVRVGYRAWSAGMYVRGFGSLVASCVRETVCLAEYAPWRDSFFFESYRDGRLVVQLPRELWKDAYCADKLASSGRGVASVKPFNFDGRAWIITSVCSGGSEPAHGEAWSLCPFDSWRGETYSYGAQCEAANRGLIERSDHRGLIVRVRNALYVVDGAMEVFDPASRKRSGKPAAKHEQRLSGESLDIDGNPLYPGARCVVAAVHHPVFQKEIGQSVIVVSVHGEQVWTHKDDPIRYRKNRSGRRVVDYDPKCIQSIHAAASLRLQRASDGDGQSPSKPGRSSSD